VNSQQIGSYCERYSPDFIIIAKLYAIWVCGLDTNKLAQKIIFALYWPKQLLEVWAFGKKLAQKKIKKRFNLAQKRPNFHRLPIITVRGVQPVAVIWS
jgi:hypothetical protein